MKLIWKVQLNCPIIGRNAYDWVVVSVSTVTLYAATDASDAADCRSWKAPSQVVGLVNSNLKGNFDVYILY